MDDDGDRSGGNGSQLLAAVVARPLAPPRGGPLMRLLLAPEPSPGPPVSGAVWVGGAGPPAASSVVGVALQGPNGSEWDALCGSEALPSLHDYLAAINVAGACLFTAGALAVLATLLLYADTLRRALPRGPASAKAPTAFVLAVYPVVALASFCAVLVPRAQLLGEAVTQGAFTAAVYQLFCLLLAYAGGAAEAARAAKPQALDTRVGPCCCWPCCCCLPQFHLHTDNIRRLRFLVLQLPVVQGLVYLVLLVMWAEEESLYQVNYMYVQPVVVLSILCGVWGLSMAMRALQLPLQGRRCRAKFLALQAVLLLAKAQGLAARSLQWGGALPCRPPHASPAVYANLVYNASMLAEMVVLSLIARHLYTSPSPPNPSSTPSPSPIYVIGDKKQLTNTVLALAPPPPPSPAHDGHTRA